MGNYNYSDELQHHGIKGMKWGVRRYQNKDGTLTDAGKRRLAKREYRKDLKAAINEAKQSNNKPAATYMTARVNRGSAYVKNVLGSGVKGGLKVGAFTAWRGLKKGADTQTIGRKFVAGAISGSAGGMVIGAFRAKIHINRGELFSESKYGVDPMYKRLDKLGVKPKKSKEYEESLRKTKISEWDSRAKNEQAAFELTVKNLKQLKETGPTGSMMRKMYGDDALTNKREATRLWKAELDDWNHQANVEKSRVDAYKKASKALSSMNITNATGKDITHLGESVVNRSFNEDSDKKERIYYNK